MPTSMIAYYHSSALHLCRLFLLGLLFGASTANALSLGEIQATSTVGKELEASITLESRKSIAADQVLVSVAPRSVYDRMGVYWEYFHANLRFETEQLGSKRVLVRLSSVQPITEPYINFVLSVRWPDGLITKEYTLLLEMDKVREGGGRRAPVQVVDSMPSSNLSGAGDINDDAVSSSSSLAPSASSRTTVSTTGSLSNQTSGIATQPTVAAEPSWNVDTQYGDTLWSIASRIESESGVHVRKVMQALYENNPQAFGADANQLRANTSMSVSLNQLRSASRLVIPSQTKARAESAFAKQDSTSKSASGATATSVEQSKGDTSRGATEEVATTNQSKASGGVLSIVTDPVEEISAAEKAVADDVAKADASLQAAAAQASGNALAGNVDSELQQAKEKADAIEARLNSLVQQYEVLSEKTEQLKELEASLNRRIAEKAAEGIDAPLSSAEIAAANGARSQSGKGFFERYRWLIIAIAGLAIVGLVIVALTRVGRMVPEEPATQPAVEDWDDTAFLDDKRLDDDELAEMVRLKGERAFTENQSAELDSVGSAETAENSVELQAAMYIAYERYEEAEEMINASLLDQPDNTPLKLQLLEIFSARQDRQQFELLATRLRELNDDQINATIDTLGQF